MKQPYKVVKRTYREEFGKDLSYSTFSTWKISGSDLLDPEFRGVNCRGSYKQYDIVESFEEEVLNTVLNSKNHVDGVAGLVLEF